MINIVVPMAGFGARFSAVGELVPKPLIEVERGNPMITYVIDGLTLSEPHRFIFVCQAEHEAAFGISTVLRRAAPDCEVIFTAGPTAGPAATALLAARFIDTDDELIVTYCDGFLTISGSDVMATLRAGRSDGGMFTYPSADPFDSYAVVSADGVVERTAEKQMISAHATAGLYYFARGRDFVAGARCLIEQNAEGSTEVFVCPVYNELVARGRRILAHPIHHEQQVDMGTPQALAAVRRRLIGAPLAGAAAP